MTCFRQGLCACALIAMGWQTGSTQARDGGGPAPLQQTVSYGVYDDPDDPNRSLIWLIVAHLQEPEADGNLVGWAVQDVHLFDATNPERVWIDAQPSVGTLDGLWWIEHADPQAPQLEEFDSPPQISGLTACEDPNEPDLEYEFEGETYIAPPGGPHFALATALNLRLWEDQSAPLIERESEPVEMGIRECPPIIQ